MRRKKEKPFQMEMKCSLHFLSVFPTLYHLPACQPHISYTRLPTVTQHISQPSETFFKDLLATLVHLFFKVTFQITLYSQNLDCLKATRECRELGDSAWHTIQTSYYTLLHFPLHFSPTHFWTDLFLTILWLCLLQWMVPFTFPVSLLIFPDF